MNNDTNGASTGKLVFKTAVGVVLGVGVTLVFMLLFSLIMLKTGISRNMAVPFATVSIAAGTFASAFYAARCVGNRGYLVGIIVGAAVFALLTVISLIASGGGITLNTLFHFIIIMLSSAAGGIIGVNAGKGKSYI